MRRYVYPHLGGLDLGVLRIRGHGLGNLLFPWARATIAARDHNLIPINPTWPQLKPGHFMRGESDYRTYRNLFRTTPDSVTGLHKLWLLCTAVRESEFALQKFPQERRNRSSIVQFAGMDQMFEPFLEEHAFLKKKLLEIVLPEHTKGMEGDHVGGIGIHVRRGDFCIANRSVDITWYCEVVEELKRKLGKNVRFNVFTDGTSEELAPLLKKPDVQMYSFGSSIADLLALSCSGLLVGSAGSTFSMWAGYLGQMPAVWPRHKIHEKGNVPKLLYNQPLAECEWMPEMEMKSDFIVQARKHIRSNPVNT
ncbi:alpha-1,2-fucosyltransferase [Desulfospira joergensenii]|uniref:alpha-1,2-fucosyltransferase n=1 Tax=Desulfospira joergensenii TaxID=53329 RepID=UPI0004031BF9|nr:alpha-1,2-fucosyltransferase [Desulfospira joergensenii]